MDQPQPQNFTDMMDQDGKIREIPNDQLEHLTKLYHLKPVTEEDYKTLEDHEKYGPGIGNYLGAAGAGAARGASFGTSDAFLTKTGLVKPETLKGLEKEHPYISGGFDVGSAVATSFIPGSPTNLLGRGAFWLAGKTAPYAGKLASSVAGKSPIIQGAIKGALTHIPGSSLEATFFGLGHEVSEFNISDNPQEVADNLLSHLTFSALWGGGVGIVFGGVGGAWRGRALKKLGSIGSNAEQTAYQEALNAAKADGMKPTEAPGFEVPTTETPFQDMRKMVQDANLGDLESLERPDFKRLKEVGEVLDSQNHLINPEPVSPLSKPAPFQYEIAQDPHKAARLAEFEKSGQKEAKLVSDFKAHQKHAATNELEKAVKSISDQSELRTTSLREIDKVTLGEKLVADIKTKFDRIKKTLGDEFSEFDKIAIRPLSSFEAVTPEAKTFIEKIEPSLVQYLTENNGVYSLGKWDIGKPVTDLTWKRTNQSLEALSKKDATVQTVRNVRRNIQDSIFDTDSLTTQKQLGRLNAQLMDYMKRAVKEANPNLDVEGIFKGYAINARNIEEMGKVLGGNFNKLDTYKGAIIPEKVLDNIFSDAIDVKTSREALGPHLFNRALSDYLATNILKYADLTKDYFSSKQFVGFLKRKNSVLKEAFRDQPYQDQLTKIWALSDFMRILPDAAPFNTSNTTASWNMYDIPKHLFELSKVVGVLIEPHKYGAHIKSGAGKVSEFFDNKAQIRNIEDIMKGSPSVEAREAQILKLGKIERAFSKTQEAVSKGAKTIFKSINEIPYSGFIGHKMADWFEDEKATKFNKFADELQELNNNPELLLNKLEESTKDLYEIAPETTNAVIRDAIAGIQYLGSKLPQRPDPGPFNEPYQPSMSELSEFEHNYSIVNNPLMVFDEIRAGTLIPDTIEALSTVYPSLYQEMKLKVFEELTDHKRKNHRLEPYLKESLSLFLGIPANQGNLALSQNTLNTLGMEQAKNDARQQARGAQAGLKNLNPMGMVATPAQSSQNRRLT